MLIPPVTRNQLVLWDYIGDFLRLGFAEIPLLYLKVPQNAVEQQRPAVLATPRVFVEVIRQTGQEPRIPIVQANAF
jgi:hypothetical protein